MGNYKVKTLYKGACSVFIKFDPENLNLVKSIWKLDNIQVNQCIPRKQKKLFIVHPCIIWNGNLDAKCINSVKFAKALNVITFFFAGNIGYMGKQLKYSNNESLS